LLTAVIVDDSIFQREILRVTLEELGFEVLAEAENGEEGYEKYKEYQPDLVTMDINMPVLNGLESVKKIIADFPDANIVMISSHAERGLAYDAIGLGAKDFVNKPMDLEICKKKIKDIFN